MVHEMLLEGTPAAQPSSAEALTKATATVKRAFWDNLQARLSLQWSEGRHVQLASDLVGLVCEVQQDLLQLAPATSSDPEAVQIRSQLTEAIDGVRVARCFSCSSVHADCNLLVTKSDPGNRSGMHAGRAQHRA